MEASGPTAVAGWKKYVTGEPFVRSRSMLLIGDSGSHIYGSGGTRHSVSRGLDSHVGYPRVHGLTEVGGHPRRCLELAVDWENRHLQRALPQSGKPMDHPTLGVALW